MSIPNQVIVYRFYDPQNKLGMRGICEKYWKGKYYSEALPDYLFTVNNQSESSGLIQFGVENCGQVQFVAQFPEAFFTVNTCTCTYVWI